MNICNMRSGGQCSLLNLEVGVPVALKQDDCDKCWLSGGPIVNNPVRAKMVELCVNGLRLEPGNMTDEQKASFIEKHKGTVNEDSPKSHWKNVRPTWEAALSFTKSVASDLVLPSIDAKTLSLRQLSCFGKAKDGTLVGSPCSALYKMQDGRHFCNECGCGERELAVLDGDGKTKLHYPYLECPRKMAGFSNHQAAWEFQVDVDNCGHGDVITALSLVHGLRKAGFKTCFVGANQSKRDLLAVFGELCGSPEQQAVRVVFGNKTPSYKFETTIDRGSTDRAVLYARFTGVDIEPVKGPFPHQITPEAIQTAKDMMHGKPYVVLFPFADFNTRMWPLGYWLDLAWGLAAKGIPTVTMFPENRLSECKSFPFYAWGEGWNKIASVMLGSSLVIANDSGPAHLAGALGVPTIALSGPTKNVFGYLPSVEVVSNQQVSCTGCHWDSAKGFRASCDKGCQSLMLMTPQFVIEKAAEVLNG